MLGCSFNNRFLRAAFAIGCLGLSKICDNAALNRSASFMSFRLLPCAFLSVSNFHQMRTYCLSLCVCEPFFAARNTADKTTHPAHYRIERASATNLVLRDALHWKCVNLNSSAAFFGPCCAVSWNIAQWPTAVRLTARLDLFPRHVTVFGFNDHRVAR